MQPGQVFADRFKIEALIGEGGVGRVYRATDARRDLPVALKCLRPEYAKEARIRRRFMREARAQSRLGHPNIVRMFDYGEDRDGVPYIAMELIDGVPMSERRKDDLSLAVILHLADQILAALAYIHARGIIHRDVKPENIVVVGQDDPEKPGAKLLDFGFARVEDDADPRLTAVNQDAFGTPQYMAPEQASGKGKVGPPTDLYAMGVILYEFITGSPPFTGAHGMAVALKHLMEPVPPLHPRPGMRVPPGLEAVVMRALKKEPHERFASAAELRRALAPYHAGGGRLIAQGPQSDAAARIAQVVGATPAQPAAGSVEILPSAPETGPMAAIDPDGPAIPRAAELPIFGREDEQLWLWSQVHRVFEAGTGRLVLLGARPGMGKSRMIGWLRDQIAEGGWMLTIGGVHRPGGRQAATGLRGAIEELFGELPEDREPAEAALREVLLRWGADGEVRAGAALDEVGVAALASYLRPQAVGSQVRSQARDEARGEVLFARICDALRLAARTRPILLTLEGVEEAASEVNGFLVHLAATMSREPFPLLALVSFDLDAEGRPLGPAAELNGALASLAGAPVERRDLEPLEHRPMLALLEALGPCEPRLADGLARRTHGNPFFARELLLLLRQTGQLVDRGGKLTVAHEANPKLWPRTLDETLLQRAKGSLARLADGEFVRRVLECAVVLGEGFDYPLLVDYLTRIFTDRPRVERAVEALLEARLLAEDRNPEVDRLHFLHGLLRNALLEGVTRTTAIRSLHLTAAEALVRYHGDRPGPVASRIAEHYQQGGRFDEAARYCMIAATNAREEGQLNRALEMLEAGDRLLSKLGSADAARRRATLWLDLGELELQRGGEGRARTLVARVHQWAQGRGEAQLVGRALLLIGDLCRRQGQQTEAGTAYARAAEAFAAAEDQRGVARAALGRAMVERARGRAEPAIELYEQARKAMAQLGDDLGVARAWQGIGELALRRGDYDTARLVLGRACESYQKAGARGGASFCHWLLGEVHRRLHAPDPALDHFHVAARGYAAVGDAAGLARAHTSLARLLAEQSRLGEAAGHYRHAITAWHNIGDVEKATTTREELGMLALEQRQFALAGECLEEALSHVIDTGDEAREVVLRASLAWIAAEQGDPAACDLELRAALDLDSRSPVIDDDLARALEGIAEVDARDGDDARAARLVRQAIRIHQSLGGHADAERLQHQLAQLEGSAR